MRLVTFLSLIFFGLILCSFSWAQDDAQLSIRSVENASYSSLNWPFTISGSIAGNSCINTDVCSTCELANCWQRPLCACATKRITDRAVVRVNLNRTKEINGNAIVSLASGGVFPSVTPNNRGEFVDVRWGDLCRRMGSSCEDMGSYNNSMTLKISIDANNNGSADSGEPFVLVTLRIVNPGSTSFNVYGAPNEEGVGSFRLEGQDGAVQFTMIQVHPNFPFLSYGARAVGLRVYVSKDNLLKATPAEADQVVDLKLIDINNIESVVSGLENGQRYFFRLAVLDDGGSVVQFFPGFKSLPSSCTSAPDDTCPYAVRPSATPQVGKGAALPSRSGPNLALASGVAKPVGKRVGLTKRM